MASRRLNHWYLVILAVLTGVALSGIAVMIFVAQAWWARLAVFFGVGGFVVFVFMGVTFWFGGDAGQGGE